MKIDIRVPYYTYRVLVKPCVNVTSATVGCCCLPAAVAAALTSDVNVDVVDVRSRHVQVKSNFNKTAFIFFLT